MSKNTQIGELINYISVNESGDVVLSNGHLVATQNYVSTAVANLVDAAPATLDTLNELAAALGDDPNFATTITTSIGNRVPYTGATADVDLGIYSITPSMVYISGSGTGGAGVLNLKKGTSRVVGGADAANTISIWADNTTCFGFNDWVSGNTRSAKFSVASISNNQTRTYTLPNTDGTLALTTDLGSYLPLTGGTLTGALNGTSASFSGAVRGNGIEITNTANADILDIFQSPSTLNSFIDYPSGRSLILRNKANGFGLTLASTGAATFSSSVTAASGKFASANGTTYAATPQLRIDGNGVNNSYAQIVFTDSALSDGKISYFPAAAAENRFFSISARQTESDFVIRGSGNVGIGTASPNARLHVLNSTGGNTSSNYIQVEGSIADNSNYPGIVLKGGTLATTYPYISLTNGGLGLSLNGGFSTAYNNPTQINLNNGVISFATGSNASATERMRITSEGYLKASNTGTYANATGTYHELNNNVSFTAALAVRNTNSSPSGQDILFTSSPNNTSSAFLYCADGTEGKFVVFSNGDVDSRTNSYGGWSDIKLKENIQDATPKLDDLMKVKVKNYNFIGDEKKQLGVIAQELEEIFPALVSESPDFEEVEVPQVDEEGNEILNEDGEVVTEKQRVSKGTTTKSVKYSVFVPMLIKAIQELKAENDLLKARLDNNNIN